MSEEHTETTEELSKHDSISTQGKEVLASDTESLESLEQLEDFISTLDKVTTKEATPVEEQLEGVESEKEFQDMDEKEQEKYGL